MAYDNRGRQYRLPTAEQVSTYARGVLTSPKSSMPGLTALEAVSAFAYARTLPMSRDRTALDYWRATDEATRTEWVDQTRAEYEALLT